MISKVKTRILAQEYLSNGLNATKAVKKYKPNLSNKVAGITASRMLDNDRFKNSLQEVMEEQGITDDLLLKEHKKVIIQSKHLPSKNTAIDMAYKLKGSYAPDKKQVSNLNININDSEQVLKRLKDLRDELKEATGDTPGA